MLEIRRDSVQLRDVQPAQAFEYLGRLLIRGQWLGDKVAMRHVKDPMIRCLDPSNGKLETVLHTTWVPRVVVRLGEDPNEPTREVDVSSLSIGSVLRLNVGTIYRRDYGMVFSVSDDTANVWNLRTAETTSVREVAQCTNGAYLNVG